MRPDVWLSALAVPSFRQGGAGVYTATLIDGLARDPGVALTVLLPGGLMAEQRELMPTALVEPLTPRRLGAPARAVNRLAAVRRPWTLDVGTRSLPGRPDVVHWPISFMHAPAPASARRVLTVLDLQHEFFPQFFSRSDRLLRRMRWRPSARAADHLIAISEFTRRTVIERYGVDPDRVTTIPLACRRELLDARPETAALPAPLDDGRPFVLYPASPLGAKNHDRLLAAAARLRGRGALGARLVLTGPRLHAWDAIHAAVAERGLSDDVVVLHHVGDAVLRTLYVQARGMVFPSLFEGFGLPVLEAMAAGCPVACSTAGSLPEVAGDAATMFDPESVEAIAAAFGDLIALDGEERARVVVAGRAHARTFTPERMVSATVDVYREVAA